MLNPIMSVCALLCVSSLFLASEAQIFDAGAASLGSAPVGFISRVGVLGDQDNIASLGNAPVGVYQRRQYPPQPWYPAPRIPFVQVYPPAKPPVRPSPIVRPPVKPPCQLPGPCRDQVVKPVVPVKPPCRSPGPCRGQGNKPVISIQPPGYKPVVRPQGKPVVPPPAKPPVRRPVPARRPLPPRRPRPYRPSSKPRVVQGRII